MCSGRIGIVPPIRSGRRCRQELAPRFARFATWLGVVPFSLYAVHRPILGFAQAVAPHVPLPPTMTGWATVAVLLARSVSLAERYEAPMRRRITVALRPGFAAILPKPLLLEYLVCAAT